MVNLIYTHSSYFDVLDATFKCHKENSPTKDFVFISDKPYQNYKTLTYKNENSYFSRISSVLNNVESDIVIFQHEDMPLYSKPNIECFFECVDALKKYDYVRLARTGSVKLSGSRVCDIESRECFVLQPTIWRTEKLKQLFSSKKNYTMMDCETNLYLDEFKGAVWYDGESAVGGHYRSKCWPYIATAIVKGKWNCSEYISELRDFQINTSFRGEV